MTKKITAEEWKNGFLYSVKKLADGAGNVYLAMIRIMLAIVPLVKLPEKEYVIAVNNAMRHFQLIMDAALRMTKENKHDVTSLLYHRVLYQAIPLTEIAKEDLTKIKEFLENEEQAIKKGMGKRLEFTLKEQLGDKISFANYDTIEHTTQIAIYKADLRVSKSGYDETMEIFHTHVPKDIVLNIIKDYYTSQKYEEVFYDAGDNNLVITFEKDNHQKMVAYTWFEDRILIDIQDQ